LARQTLFMQGEPAAAVYNVTAGVVRIYKLLPDGRRQIVGFSLLGDFLGLALNETYGFSADAIEPVAASRVLRTRLSSMTSRISCAGCTNSPRTSSRKLRTR
jgi:CRP/FNR family transcriptional regulator